MIVKNHIIFKTITLALFLLICNFSFAQDDTVTISGRITDAKSGEGIPYAHITFLNPIALIQKQDRDGINSNFKGYYSVNLKSFSDSIQNDYSMTIQYIGYITREVTPIFEQNKSNIEFNFTLKKNSNLKITSLQIKTTCKVPSNGDCKVKIKKVRRKKGKSNKQ